MSDERDAGPAQYTLPSTVRTHIAQIDPEAGTLRYRGVDIDDLVGTVTFGQVWSLLVDDDFAGGLPPAEQFPLPVRTGDPRVDVQSALTQLAPVWGFQPLHDISPELARDQLARASVMAMSFVAQAARDADLPAVPQREVAKATSVAERFIVRWRGETDPLHVAALDAYFVAAAEHGLTSSSLTARIIASTGADVAACLSGAVGALSGPRDGGAPSRVLTMLRQAAELDDVDAFVAGLLGTRSSAMAFGRGVYVAGDPRAAALREACRRLRAPLYDVAIAVEDGAERWLRGRNPDLPSYPLMEFWAPVMLDLANVPQRMFTAMFACARTAGWSAHILEQHGDRRPVRGVAEYVGHGRRRVTDVHGWGDPSRR